MGIQHCFMLFLFLVLLGVDSTKDDNRRPVLHRSSFPDGFVFGAGSSAYQFEGAAHIDGKRPSIWDTFTNLHPEKIEDHSNGNVADDFYHLFQEDIGRMKEIGLDSYRFSISWSRIMPEGKISKGVNWEGVKFYNYLIDELLLNGIKPLVTLFHWDLPQALEDDYKGFLSPNVVNDYHDYVDFCFKEFGDRVKQWITLNEPNLFSIFGYAYGEFAPGRCSDYIGNCSEGNSATEPYLVVHHEILCHATAVQLYKEKYQASQNGIIGLTVFVVWFVPKYDTDASKKAAARAGDFLFEWIIHPIVYGNYPESMQYLVGDRLPKFTKEEEELIRGSFDYIGINYYTSEYADPVSSYSSVNLSYTTDSRVNLTYWKEGVPIGEPTACSWLYIYPKGFQDALLYLNHKYNSPTFYITENGMADSNTLSLEDALEDNLRIKYYSLHLLRLLEAIKEGVDLRGYYAWSFLDDFEWNSGYTLRFGFTYVDYKNNLRRILKSSALWYKSFLQEQNSTSLLYSK